MTLHRETRGEGEEILLVHGWGMNAAVWAGVVDALSSACRVTTLELPGHGRSPCLGERAGFDDWVEACLDAAPARAAWLGWSLGGQIAQRAAVLAPERVSRLVLVASTPRFVQGEGWSSAIDERTLRLFHEALVRDPLRTLERFLSLQVKGDDAERQTLRSLRQGLAQHPPATTVALAKGLEFLLSVDLREHLGEIDRPLLWILGARDTLVPAGVAGPLSALAPRSEIQVLAGSAHAPFLSHPAESLALLRGFACEPRG